MKQYLFAVVLKPNGTTTDIYIPAMNYHITGFESDLENAIKHARKEIQGFINLRSKEFISDKLSESGNINYEEDSVVVYIDIDPIRITPEKIKYIKKTLSIPEYLNRLGVERNLNFSQVLTNGLKKELNITIID